MNDLIFTDKPMAVEHAGVKGMKWGVRKDDSGGGRTSGMSDSALQAAVNRMNLEKNFERLMEERRPTSAFETAVNKTADILAKAAQEGLQQYANKRVAAFINKTLPQA